MKTVIFALVTLFAINAQAAPGQPKRIYTCETNTDPDSLSIEVYSAFGKVYALLSTESCDGDCGAEDVIELQRVDTGNDAVSTYRQIAGSEPSVPGLKIKDASRKTRGLILNLGFLGGNSKVKASSDPLGNKLPSIDLECKSIINPSN